MNHLRSSVCLLLALGAASQAGALATPAAEGPGTRDEAARAWRAEGLQAIKVRGMDVAYSQPGASLQAFHSIVLKPVTVSFQKNWARSAAIPTGTRLRPRDADRIRNDMAGVLVWVKLEKATFLPDGAKVKVLEFQRTPVRKLSCAKVEILDGPYAGRGVWTLMNGLNPAAKAA